MCSIQEEAQDSGPLNLRAFLVCRGGAASAWLRHLDQTARDPSGESVAEVCDLSSEFPSRHQFRTLSAAHGLLSMVPRTGWRGLGELPRALHVLLLQYDATLRRSEGTIVCEQFSYVWVRKSVLRPGWPGAGVCPLYGGASSPYPRYSQGST